MRNIFYPLYALLIFTSTNLLAMDEGFTNLSMAQDQSGHAIIISYNDKGSQRIDMMRLETLEAGDDVIAKRCVSPTSGINAGLVECETIGVFSDQEIRKILNVPIHDLELGAAMIAGAAVGVLALFVLDRMTGRAASKLTYANARNGAQQAQVFYNNLKLDAYVLARSTVGGGIGAGGANYLFESSERGERRRINNIKNDLKDALDDRSSTIEVEVYDPAIISELFTSLSIQ